MSELGCGALASNGTRRHSAGVGIVGHRRKLLDAIAILRADESAKPPSPDAVPVDRTANDNAERRQVTVVFSDLVGSTALSARMDPEDLREVISTLSELRCRDRAAL
jgi:class 3 adenylate cyclase